MLKVALVKVPATYANWYRRPVIGLASLQAVLRRHGYEVKIFDSYFHNWNQDELIQKVIEYRPNVVGFTAMTHEVVAAAAIATTLSHSLVCSMLIGGCHVTALPERTMTEYPVFDYGVIGEGENSLIELLEHLESPQTNALEAIDGIIYRDNGLLRQTGVRAFLSSAELDALPFPDFSDYYSSDGTALQHKNDEYVLFSARGCPYNCVFCMQVLGRKVRQRSPENILKEIRFAMKTYGAHRFDFCDEIFLMDRANTRDLLQEIIASGLSKQIRWTGLTRANLVTKELIDLAKRAGCIRLSMGVESGDEDILIAINKRIRLEQIRTAVAIIMAAKIKLETYYILGHPGETLSTASKTIDFAISLNTDGIAVGLMVPYPGTQIYEMAKNNSHGYSLLSERWEEFDKYGGRALRIEGLPYETLERLQMGAYTGLYLKNKRWLDLLRFAWSRRRGVYYMMKKRFSRAA